MYYGNAAEIWNAAKEIYSNVDNNISVIFEIKSLSHNLQQGDSLVTEYYHTFTKYWQQLDIYANTKWKCPEDEKIYKKLIAKDRISQFLLGLNKNLDEVRGRILGTKPLLSIREAFGEVREESRRKAMLEVKVQTLKALPS